MNTPSSSCPTAVAGFSGSGPLGGDAPSNGQPVAQQFRAGVPVTQRHSGGRPATQRPGVGLRVLPVDATGRVPRGTRALVLGGGGSTGNAWLIGVIAGLFDAGLDVTDADLIVGTSAGSTAAAQITGSTQPELFAATIAPVPSRQTDAGQRPSGPGAGAAGAGAARPSVNHMERTGAIIAAASNAAEMRRRLGADALRLEVESDGTWAPRWRATVAARLPSQEWPDRVILMTAVDARTGEPVVFDQHSGVGLADAIAASTSSALPYAIGADRFIDGGYRRNENADLAAGYERVLVLSPFGGRTRMPLDWGMQLSAQVDELRAAGSSVEVVGPDADAEHMFGPNAMDLTLRPAAAQAGYNQGRALAAHLGEFWR